MSGPHYGDFPTSHTAVCMIFDSFAASTGAPSATSNFAAGDIVIFKDGGTTQRTSSNGIVVSTSFDSNTGLQMVTIDLSDNSDSGFYAAGHEYQVAVADITIDSQTVRFWLGSFSIERAGGILALLKAGTAKVTLADGVAHGGTLGSGTATLALSQFNVTSQTSNTSAFTLGGNGSGHGFNIAPGATGHGIKVVGGATSGDAINALGGGSGHGFTVAGIGGNHHGINAVGFGTGSGISGTGGGTGHGILGTSGTGASGDGIKGIAASTDGNGINFVGNGNGSGMLTTGGAGAAGDGIKAVAGGGVPIRGSITGNLVGTVSTLTTYTGNTPQTGDVYALANGATGFAAIAGYIDTEIANIQSRLPAALVGGRMDSSTGAMAANVLTAAATAADFGAEVADAFLDRDMSTGTDSGSTTVRTPRQALRAIRNKISITTGTLTVTKEDDATASWTAAVTTDAGAVPITAVDPAGP